MKGGRARSAGPRFLVADEAVSVLDVTVQKQVLALLEDLRRKFGFAYLFITHDRGVVEQIADRVVVIYRGRILETGPRDAIFADARHPYTLRLLQAAPRSRRRRATPTSITVACRDSRSARANPRGSPWVSIIT